MSNRSGPSVAVLAAALAALSPLHARAQSPDDVQALRAQFEQLRRDYQGRIEELEARLAQLESQAAPVAASESPARAEAMPPAAVGPGNRAASASAFNPAMSVVLMGSYRDLSQDPEDWHIAGFIPGGDELGPGDRGFSLDESEITLSASVDPYFDAALTVALAGEGEVEVEEAFVRTSALPAGLRLRAGRFFSGVGDLNVVHAHAWSFADLPLAYQAMFGGQLALDGVQLKWLAPTEMFLEFGAELGSGNAFPATRRQGNGFDSWTAYAHVGGDLGDSAAWRAGVSYLDATATGRAYEDVDALGTPVVNAFTGDSTTWIVDAKLKFAPRGAARRNAVELQAEYFRRDEDGELGFDVDGSALSGGYDASPDGWYAQAVWWPVPRWGAGLRWDSLDSGTPYLGLVADGTLTRADFPLLLPGSPTRLTLMGEWRPSEFSRVRAQFARDDARDSGDADEQWLLQYVHAIGAHGAHAF